MTKEAHLKKGCGKAYANVGGYDWHCGYRQDSRFCNDIHYCPDCQKLIDNEIKSKVQPPNSKEAHLKKEIEELKIARDCNPEQDMEISSFSMKIWEADAELIGIQEERKRVLEIILQRQLACQQNYDRGLKPDGFDEFVNRLDELIKAIQNGER